MDKDHILASKRWPKNLVEVVQSASFEKDEDFWLNSLFSNFLDAFYVAAQEQRQTMLDPEPPSTGSARIDAYLGAVAEHLATKNGLTPPDWTNGETRFLRRAYFPSHLQSMRAMNMAFSPAAFRRRMIFVDHDPLYRPRRAEPPAPGPMVELKRSSSTTKSRP